MHRWLRHFLHPWIASTPLFLLSLWYFLGLQHCRGACVTEARLFLGSFLAAVGALLLLYEFRRLKPLYLLALFLTYVLLAIALTTMFAQGLARAIPQII